MATSQVCQAGHPMSSGDSLCPVCGTLILDSLPPPSLDPLPTLPGYKVLQELGRGGMGVVYLAEDVRLKRHVAVKILQPWLNAQQGAAQRFLREAQMMAAVEHPHIARIYQVGEQGGQLYLVMEYLRGQSLEERLHGQKTFPWQETARLGRQIAAGLAAAHQRGLVHRDIKPANIFLEKPDPNSTDAQVKILDFGLARAQADQGRITREGIILGTPGYMSPEQTRGAAVDARTDLFSLGVLLYRLGTGVMPFEGPDTVSQLLATAQHEPPPPCQVNPAFPVSLSNLVMKLLAKKVEERFPSASDLATVLAQLEKTSEVNLQAAVGLDPLKNQASPAQTADWQHVGVTPPVPFRPSQPRGSRWLALVLIAACAGAGWALWKFWPGPNPALPKGPFPLLSSIRRGEVVLDLAEALPLIPGDKLQIRSPLPRDAKPALFYLDSQGKLAELTDWQLRPGDDFDQLVFPPKGTIQLRGPPGMEFLLVCAGSSPPPLATVANWLGKDRTWPVIPQNIVVLLDRDKVHIVKGSVPRGQDRAAEDALSHLENRLENLRRLLRDQSPFFAGIAYPLGEE